ncbi:hypothetical protein Sjap_019819 [Stephania japonica]|uniref:Late embryogenesis abundant protein LEA-2 subgroup domain-containing protein n=1 Tax=Stephania japonica TaxID=461633 RepID=A0AAP0EZI0_9MAGN
MTDRIYPSAKPAGAVAPASANGTNPSFPATKAQLYGASRPPYRPQPKPQRYRRSCCCSCILWTIILLIALVFLVAIAGAIFWVLYRPQRPNFSVTTLRFAQFNVTRSKDGSSRLNSKLDLAVSTRNPNKKIVFGYDPITVSVSSNGVGIGDGTVPAFVHERKNTTLLKASVMSAATELDSSSASSLSADLKRKSGLPLEIEMDTKVQVKIGSLKAKKVGIRVSCSGIQAVVPKGKEKSTTPVSDSIAKCKVDLRIKIWKWTF